VADASHFEAPKGARGPALLPPSIHPTSVRGLVDPDAVGRLTDPVARNHAITQGYHALSREMGALLGHEAVSWVGFGAWGSAQVGQELRREDPPGGLQDVLEQVQAPLRALSGVDDLLLSAGLPPISERITRLEGDTLRATFEAALADGNQAIFNALAGPFARFITAVHGERGSVGDAVARFADGLAEDEPLLGEAFRGYAAALQGSSEDRDASILLANDQVGLVAQARLAPALERLHRAPVEAEVRRTLEGAVTSLSPQSEDATARWAGMRGSPALEAAIDVASQAYGRLFREAATGVIFRQAIPHETLGRSEALTRAGLGPTPRHGGPDRFDALLAALGPTGAAEKPAASPDRFIEHLVRRQRDASWFEAPQSQGASSRAPVRDPDPWR